MFMAVFAGLFCLPCKNGFIPKVGNCDSSSHLQESESLLMGHLDGGGNLHMVPLTWNRDACVDSQLLFVHTAMPHLVLPPAWMPVLQPTTLCMPCMNNIRAFDHSNTFKVSEIFTTIGLALLIWIFYQWFYCHFVRTLMTSFIVSYT